MNYHVYPQDEEREHLLNANWRHCECIPREEVVKDDSGRVVGSVVVHAAFDGRELTESEYSEH